MNQEETTGFTVQATLTRYNPLSDRGISLLFHTNKEINSDEQKLKVINMHLSTGWLLFKPNEIQEKEIPTSPAVIDGKSPSKRLYNVLFVYWNQMGKKGKYQDFYEETMEKLINHYKEKLI